jgi:putative FmdB family regulatory protein
MPLYEYECGACGHRFEIIQKFSDGPPDACPQCGKGPLQRQFSSPAIQFKGTGWYVTDYAGKGKSASEKSEKAEKSGGESKPAESKSDAASTDSGAKSDTKSDTKKSDAPASTSTPAAKD